MRAPTLPRASLIAAALAALVAIQACGDTLIDHDGKDFVTPDGGLACLPPNHACGAGCVAQSVDACGASCAVCVSAPANGAPACLQRSPAQDFQCGYTCAAGFLECRTGCCRTAAVAAGGDHACAVAEDGTLVCWGANESGQLGPNATGASSRTPVRVLDSGVTAVAAGTAHTCAVHVGTLKCWGDNGSGQLGNGNVQPGPTPVSTGLTGVAAVAAGRAHTCAVVAGGAVKCWGANASGQLGTGTAGGLQLSPVSSLAAGVSRVAAALDHVCALAGTAVSCWGANERGQSGSADLASKPTPVAVPLPGGATFVVTGHLHSCAGVPGLGLHCWGDDRQGQMGNGTVGTVPVAAPVQASRIDNGQRSVDAAAGRGHTCSVKDDGTIKCGGLNDANQAGASPNDPELDGFDVGLGGVRAVSSGNDHTCAVVDEGAPGNPALAVKCWGKNDKGQLGRDTAGAPSGVPDYAGK